jgi:hypothetical protein
MSESLNEPRKEDAMLHQMLLKREIPAEKNEYFRRFSSFRLRLLQFEKTTPVFRYKKRRSNAFYELKSWKTPKIFLVDLFV